MRSKLHAPIIVVILGALAASCLPAHLQKYRKDGGDKSAAVQPSPAAPSAAPASDPAIDAAARGSAGKSEPAAPRATIYAVDKHTFRFALREGDVWDSALNVLLRNYNLTIVDRQSGIVTTEWDSFFLDSAVYRNKVSLRVAPGGRGAVDVTIHNSVERLRDASQAAGAVGAVWLPAEDPANEVARIVQNMALVLNQPPPVLPPRAAVAKGDTAAPSDAVKR